MSVRRAASLVVLVSIVSALPFADVARAAAGEPTEQVQASVNELYRLLGPGAGSAADRRQREEAAAAVLDRLFDWRTMARQALQQHWEERTPPEREEFTRLFADLFRQAYLARMSLVEASRFRYLGDHSTGDKATVDTQVTTKRGSTIAVAYLTARGAEPRWRVEDVRVEGISLLANYRTQFASIISRASYDDLVKRLRERLREH